MPPPPPPEEPSAPKSELEQLMEQANQVTDDSLASTRRMKALCEDTKEAGIRTLVALDDQGEKLDRMEKGMMDINEDMREAEEALQGMEKCCGLFTLPSCITGKKETAFKEDSKLWKGNNDGCIGSDNIPRECDNTGVPAYGGFVAKITNDAREDEMEGNMEEVSIMVGNLRNMAIDMNSAISTQNNQLDRINMMAESNETRISMANERAHQLNK